MPTSGIELAKDNENLLHWVTCNSKAIAEELQISAQNKAFELNANAIWPTSEIKNGEQVYDILKCEYQD